MVHHTGHLVRTVGRGGMASTARTRVNGVCSRTLIIETLIRFSLMEVCNVPCATSGKTSLKMPIVIGPLREGSLPSEGAITRICARIVASLASTVGSNCLTGSRAPKCVGR